MSGRVNFSNEVLLIHGTTVVVVDDFDHLYFVDNGGIESAYEIGDCVNTNDLLPLSDLPLALKAEILDEL